MMRDTHAVPIRRFEMGASGLFNDDFLQRCGYVVKPAPKRGFTVMGPAGGRPKYLSHEALIALTDAERVKRGLEPLRKIEKENALWV